MQEDPLITRKLYATRLSSNKGEYVFLFIKLHVDGTIAPRWALSDALTREELVAHLKELKMPPEAIKASIEKAIHDA
jgi:hypothetical protein